MSRHPFPATSASLRTVLSNAKRMGPIVLGIACVQCGPATPQPSRTASLDASRERQEDLHKTDDSTDTTSLGSIFHLFCEESRGTDIAESPTANDFAYLCSSDQVPTKLFAEKLPSIAYTPSSEVRLIQLAAPHHDKDESTTSITIATASKLPVTAKHYFDMMSELMDDGERATDLGVKLIDGQTKNETLAAYDGDGNKYFKGWKKHIRVESRVSDQTVVSEYINHQDHWIIGHESLYIFNSYLEESIAGIVDGRMITALVQGQESAYLLTIIHTTAANRGLPGVALEKLTTTYKEGIKNAYKNALLIKNEKP